MGYSKLLDRQVMGFSIENPIRAEWLIVFHGIEGWYDHRQRTCISKLFVWGSNWSTSKYNPMSINFHGPWFHNLSLIFVGGKEFLGLGLHFKPHSVYSLDFGIICPFSYPYDLSFSLILTINYLWPKRNISLTEYKSILEIRSFLKWNNYCLKSR